jgi:hypothetical protein
MPLETLLRLSLLRSELIELARELTPEQQRIVAYSANVLKLIAEPARVRLESDSPSACTDSEQAPRGQS